MVADSDSMTTRSSADVKLNVMDKLLAEGVNTSPLLHVIILIHTHLHFTQQIQDQQYKRIAADPFTHDPKGLIANGVKVRDQALTVYLNETPGFDEFANDVLADNLEDVFQVGKLVVFDINLH
jgi:hypothetical protein